MKESSGHRDIDGTWIEEPCAAKLRNQLNVFWTLSTMLSDKEMREKFLADKNIQDLVFGAADQCENNKTEILNLIIELANKEIVYDDIYRK